MKISDALVRVLGGERLILRPSGPKPKEILLLLGASESIGDDLAAIGPPPGEIDAQIDWEFHRWNTLRRSSGMVLPPATRFPAITTPLAQELRKETAADAPKSARPTREEFNIKARDYLQKCPTAKRKELAAAIGWSERLVCNFPAWKAVREELAKGRRPKARPAINFSKKVENNVCKDDSELDQLMKEHEQDYEPSPLELDLPDKPMRVRCRKIV